MHNSHLKIQNKVKNKSLRHENSRITNTKTQEKSQKHLNLISNANKSDWLLHERRQDENYQLFENHLPTILHYFEFTHCRSIWDR